MLKIEEFQRGWTPPGLCSMIKNKYITTGTFIPTNRYKQLMTVSSLTYFTLVFA